MRIEPVAGSEKTMAMIELLRKEGNELEPECQRVEKACRIHSSFFRTLFYLETARMTEEEQVSFDDGELPQRWVRWWNSCARRIEAFEGAALIELLPGFLGKRRVRPLEVSALPELLDSAVWTMPAGVILAWGVRETSMNRNHLNRIQCSGALGVCMDGCAALLLSEEETGVDWHFDF